MEDALWIGRDAVNSARIIPRHLRWLLKEFARKKYILDIKLNGIQKEIKLISNGIYFLGMMIFAATLVFSGVFLLKESDYQKLSNIPAIVYILWALAGATIIQASVFFRQK